MSFYMFRVSQHPSSGVLETVTAASGTVHNIGTATSLHLVFCDSHTLVPIRSRWSEVAVPILWPVPEVAVTVFSRYLFTVMSFYMFRVSQHPSSGVLETVTAASGTGHNTGTATSLPIRPRWSEVAVPVLWPVPEAAVTVSSTPDDGCCDTRNM